MYSANSHFESNRIVIDRADGSKSAYMFYKRSLVVQHPKTKATIMFVKTSRSKAYKDSRLPSKVCTETHIINELTRFGFKSNEITNFIAQLNS